MTDLVNVLDGQACSQVHFTTGKEWEGIKFVPVVKRTMGYIVGAIVFNEDNSHVLLVQEAKAKCRGLWYYPVGRLEPEESLVEGVKREVEEEAGVKITPTKLLCVETTQASWFRFTFTGPITGELKQKSDSESLQARWAPIDEILQRNSKRFPLRHADFLPLIIQKQQEVACSLLPALVPHPGLLMRLVLVKQHEADMYCLVNSGQLPVIEMQPFKLVLWPIYQLIMELFKQNLPFRTAGVLSLEHSASKLGVTDGICVSLLVQLVKPPHPTSSSYLQSTSHTVHQGSSEDHATLHPGPSKDRPISPNLPTIHAESYTWQKVDDANLRGRLESKLQVGNIVPLLVLN